MTTPVSASNRRTVHLTGPHGDRTGPGLAAVPAPVFVGRERWLRLAEVAIGHWASTLRAALLILLFFVGTVLLVAVALGFAGALIGAVLGAATLYVTGKPRSVSHR